VKSPFETCPDDCRSRPIPISKGNRWKVRCQTCPKCNEDASHGCVSEGRVMESPMPETPMSGLRHFVTPHILSASTSSAKCKRLRLTADHPPQRILNLSNCNGLRIFLFLQKQPYLRICPPLPTIACRLSTTLDTETEIQGCFPENRETPLFLFWRIIPAAPFGRDVLKTAENT